MEGTQAFTLIELLVVVLIIGILAAVAVPQYQKAVDKAKYTQAMLVGNKISHAQQQYKLANGFYSGRFDELDIDLPTPVSTRQDNAITEYYFYTWGKCWTHDVYDACSVHLSDSSRAWYFVNREPLSIQCWADPHDDARANALCQAMTKKTTGVKNGSGNGYMMYAF